MRMLFLKEKPEKRKQAKNAGLPAPRYKSRREECQAFRYARGDVEAYISLAALFTGLLKKRAQFHPTKKPILLEIGSLSNQEFKNSVKVSDSY